MASPTTDTVSKRRLFAVLLVAMVVVPLAALAWLGQRHLADSEELATHQVTALLTDRLREVDGSITRFVEGKERELVKAAEAMPHTADAIRAYMKQLPGVLDVLVVDGDGKVLFPPLGGEMSGDERAFVERTRAIWDNDELQAEAQKARKSKRAGADHGWFGFYHGSGLNLLLWRTDGDRIVALELPRIVILSDLVAYLPATKAGLDPGTPSRTTLVDANGAIVYQWGNYQPPDDEPPRATFTLQPPLAAWSLRHHVGDKALPTGLGEPLSFNLWLGLGAVALALVMLALYLFRVRTSEMRLAAQRVSFVNQVSHELKTPLTNIRLYAELLSDNLGFDEDEDSDDPAARHLGVITSESQRLSRLITNVLTFARGEEGRLEVNPKPAVVDEIVAQTLATWAPALERSGVAITSELAAPASVEVDADVVEQVLANLLSNVEKYARSGGSVTVATRFAAPDRTVITVSDRGPGIPTSQRGRIFEPFFRANATLAEGVSGTGIGLDIARRLAQLHGGGLELTDSQVGASFTLTLRTRREKT